MNIHPYEPWHEISNNVVCATTKGSDQPVHTRSLIRAFASRFNILPMLKRLSLQLWTFFEKNYFLFKSFVKAELS